MCGIVGIFNHSRKERVSESKLRMMRDSMTHRGPDGSGIYINPDQSLGLGHRRLSIIDLSELGRQPMTETSGRIHITYNGEIYNFRELRSGLENEGVVFRSRSAGSPSGHRILAPTMGPVGDTSPVAARSQSA